MGTLAENSFGTPLWDTLVEHSCVTLLLCCVIVTKPNPHTEEVRDEKFITQKIVRKKTDTKSKPRLSPNPEVPEFKKQAQKQTQLETQIAEGWLNKGKNKARLSKTLSDCCFVTL